jgi:hypothetical protein
MVDTARSAGDVAGRRHPEGGQYIMKYPQEISHLSLFLTGAEPHHAIPEARLEAVWLAHGRALAIARQIERHHAAVVSLVSRGRAGQPPHAADLQVVRDYRQELARIRARIDGLDARLADLV